MLIHFLYAGIFSLCAFFFISLYLFFSSLNSIIVVFIFTVLLFLLNIRIFCSIFIMVWLFSSFDLYTSITLLWFFFYFLSWKITYQCFFCSWLFYTSLVTSSYSCCLDLVWILFISTATASSILSSTCYTLPYFPVESFLLFLFIFSVVYVIYFNVLVWFLTFGL